MFTVIANHLTLLDLSTTNMSPDEWAVVLRRMDPAADLAGIQVGTGIGSISTYFVLCMILDCILFVTGLRHLCAAATLSI